MRTIFMKKLLTIIIALVMLCSAILLTACGDGIAEIPKRTKFVYNESEWETTFFDDFTSATVDRNKWKIVTMKSDDPLKNGVRRAAYYTDSEENVFINDGNLIMRTNYKTGEYGEGWYTAWLDTSPDIDEYVTEDYKGFSQTQGYFEIKCIAPASTGIWSAFWMMPSEGVAFTENDIQNTAKDGLEIDIMESPYYYNNKMSGCTHVLHCDGYDERLKSSKSKTYNVPNMYSEMHTYALEWTESEYKFYIDGYLTWKTPHKYDGKVFGVSEVLQHIILSVEVGGHSDEQGNLIPGIEKNGSQSWAGDPNLNDKTKNYDYIIDYVKVMKRKA